jgi:hypothetical protein
MLDIINFFYKPTKTMDWVMKNHCGYVGISKNGKYWLYWYGNYVSGYEVKVKK